MKYFILILSLGTLIACGQIDNKTQDNQDSEATDETSTNNTTEAKSIKFLWRDMKYDSTLKDTFNSIFINQDYLTTIPDAEKAAIGYIATFIGSECWWDGETANEDRSNLDCKVISALGLGYQCSETHLGFLKEWFEGDEKILSELEQSSCPTVPYTATSQNTFDEINLSVKNDSIIVAFKASGVNMREQTSWEWTETDYFVQKDKQLRLVQKDKSEVKYDTFEISEE